MFYYNIENDKCIGIISVDESKIKDDSMFEFKSDKFIPLEEATSSEIHSKNIVNDDRKVITLVTNKDKIIANGKDFAQIKILGLDYGENEVWIKINGEKIQISRSSNGEMIFNLKSNLIKTYFIEVFSNKVRGNIIKIFSVEI